MVDIGRFNKLKALRRVEFGFFLDGEEDGEILLPKRYVPENLQPGDEIEVFIYFDSEDRLVATTEKPFAQVGEFASLEIVSVEKVGAFLNWGLGKDLFLPHSEQTRNLRPQQKVVVYIYLDKTDRISSSMRVDRYIEKEIKDLKEDQNVDLMICGSTDLGYKAIVNGRHIGVLYQNEVFQDLQPGQKIKGFIRKLRDDGKIDLALQRTGHQAGGDIEPLIISELEKNKGFLPINDKTSADLIYEMFGVSKKKYKIAIGGLYKKRVISISDDGIRLVTSPTRSK